jgi:hypothetical protein
MVDRRAVLLKRCLLFGWSVWWTVVVVTNVLDACKATGLLAETWSFASGNYAFLAQTMARYGTLTWVNAVLFGGVIVWEAAAATLFWMAWHRYRGNWQGMMTVYVAFTAGLMLWLAFLVADEICIAYPVEATHLRLFIGQLLTLLAIALLPESTTRAPSPTSD